MALQSDRSVLPYLLKILGEVDHPFLQEFTELLPGNTPEKRQVQPSPLPVLNWLDDAYSNAPVQSKDLLRYLVDHCDTLHWGQTYKADDFGTEFLDRYGWSEFIGLRGPIPSNEIACGVLF